MMEIILLILVIGYGSLALGDLFLIIWYNILNDEKLKEKKNGKKR
jgi:hypothetical protein